MSAVYRNDDEVLAVKIEELRQARTQEIGSVPQEIARVFYARVSRATAGGFALVSLLASVLFFFAYVWWMSRGDPSYEQWSALRNLPAQLFFWVLASPLLGYLVAFEAAPRQFRSALAREIQRMARLEAHVAIAQLESLSTFAIAKELTSKKERSGLARLLVFAAIVGPLALHFLAYFPFAFFDRGFWEDFSVWIGLSLILVGPAHILLAVFGWRFAQRLSQDPESNAVLALKYKGIVWKYYGWVVLASVVPGIVAIAIPVLLTAVTGLVLIPLMFHSALRKTLNERAILQSAIDLPAENDPR